jgi:integrase
MAEIIGFTQRKLEGLTCPAGKDRVFFRDREIAKLVLQVTGSGTRTFYVYMKIEGRPRYIKLGYFPEISVDQARKLASRHIGNIADGKNPAEERANARGEMEFEELFARYIKGHAEAKKKDKGEEDQAQYDRHLKDWAHRKLSSIKWEHVNALHAGLGKKHPYAANRLISLLSKVFNFAKKIGFTGENPARGIEKFPEQQRVRWLDADELARFRKALDAESDQLIADFIRAALFTAARRSNVQSMAWSDVSFGRREWTVAGEKTKNGDPLVVNLTDQAMEVLQRRWAVRIDNCPWVFPSHGKLGHLVEPKAAWKRILDAAKIKDFRLHDLRHTAASWAVSAGTSLPIIGEMLGHRSQQSTARYAHVRRAAAAAALQGATSAMMGISPVAEVKKSTGKGTKRKSA